MEFLTNLLEMGVIKPVIDQCYSLDKAADAMEYLSKGHSTGKVVIKIQ
jgi:NADPH:quinone reductase-like Zn-dependent oxidoreductase